MKKILLSLMFLACGCSASVTSRNASCSFIKKYKILQVLDKGVLAYSCTIDDIFTNMCTGRLVYIPKKIGKMYYDDMIIKPAAPGECIIYEGTYQYTSKGGRKTVPVLGFIPS